jgi:hypothetical protein
MTLQDIVELFSRALRSDRHHFFTWLKKDIFRIRFLVTLLVLLPLSSWLAHLWVFEYAGIHSQEIFQKRISAIAAKSTHIVSIPLTDYQKLSEGGCITPEWLDETIRKILKYRPAVLAIDLDTSASQFQKLRKNWLHDGRLVWARDAADVIHDGEPDLELLPVLGGSDSEPSHWGLALFPRSPDWTVRSYQRAFPVGTKYKPSFYWEVVSTFCQSKPDVDGCAGVNLLVQEQAESKGKLGDTELSQPILHARYKFRITPVGDIFSSDDPVSDRNPMYDQIVLLGGFYSPGDRHPTPWGTESGVEIVGSAIEAELDPQGVQMEELTKYVFKILLALLIAAMHNWLKPICALFGTVFVLGGLVLFGSFLVLFLAGYHADIVAFLVGIWIEQLYGSAEKAKP